MSLSYVVRVALLSVVTGVSCLGGTSAAAADAPFPSLGTLKGVVLKDFTHHDTFNLPVVAVDQCDATSIDSMRVAKCNVTDGQTLVLTSDDGKTMTVNLAKFAYYYKPMVTSVDAWNEYHFIGTYEDVIAGVPMSSDAEMMLYYQDSTPADIHGWVALKKYNLSYPVQAVRE